MYKTVFSSNHVAVVSMTETAEMLIQLALAGCGLWHREVEVEKYQLIYCNTLTRGRFLYRNEVKVSSFYLSMVQKPAPAAGFCTILK